MLVTSLTSSVAFLSCTLSNIMPIRAFGIFATIVVLVCYFLTINVQPLVYFIFERYIQRKKFKLTEEKIEEQDLTNFSSVEQTVISKTLSKYIYKCRYFLFISFFLSFNYILL